ncbi:hypothetical protein [Burkholderia sp. BCC1998]|uniref:hypothetical protein n=1 Tax=Burkholderia sp. BCC1998 TaxID=2817447 RepID=UPI002AB7E6D8|nr:hypothetical protein [Burkholderia sp. BCC1998]
MSNAVIHQEARPANALSDLRAKARLAWSYKVASNYADGCRSGAAAAIAYMQYSKAREDSGGGTLQQAAIHFAEALREARTKDEMDAIRGKMVGFFSEIDQWVDFAAKHAVSTSMDEPFHAIKAILDDSASGAARHQLEEYLANIRGNRARAAATARRSKNKRSV